MPLISRDPLRPHGSCGLVGAGAVRSEVLTAQERETHILTGKFPRTNISRALKIFLKAPCEPKANASVGHDPQVTLTESSCDPRKRCEKSPAPILHIPQMLPGFPFPGLILCRLPLSKQVWWEDRHCERPLLRTISLEVPGSLGEPGLCSVSGNSSCQWGPGF